jgi:hypothetical protein
MWQAAVYPLVKIVLATLPTHQPFDDDLKIVLPATDVVVFSKTPFTYT